MCLAFVFCTDRPIDRMRTKIEQVEEFTHSSVTCLICLHILKMCSSDWITLGPAIRKKGSAAWEKTPQSTTVSDLQREERRSPSRVVYGANHRAEQLGNTDPPWQFHYAQSELISTLRASRMTAASTVSDLQNTSVIKKVRSIKKQYGHGSQK
jgi:hypothetical protein